ncbi:ABC transporter family protein [Sphingomonas sp. S17]|jgi:molybdate transport system ATP-binding protein|uniref:ATP-binding cassette domain-containing protein n=2 Tax=Sphingomonas paucimobilis TaxID=13689 RepID=A0A411LG49_SPHPI|nr:MULTISPECIES: ATP-binding cassette domain-containing protein [Sphingomonas]EGI55859.1 ABC transporter family protein [Sphingomonas sp. S17]MBQ1479701.1 ATP-binding cassette domain-containing protein [Sphingomonas sp.]MCM3679351.1 ATP-binding cassette domain-containing protein [Sphingomonas paucimobilis]MDG5972104.1 ATP-binding cassette domain-containing protein [Sphingomonas paucimobilis]NNG57892.1 ATP-binding cassette domain-containing protein [Sphingomonas paucimobilis]
MSFDVALSVSRGESRIEASFITGPGATVLFGPSGIGKTSILQMVAGLLKPDEGHVRIAGETLFDADARIDVPSERRRIGYVFQEPRLFPHMRVAANLRYGMARGGGDWDGVVAMLGIGHLLDRWPRTLSGGEARRVAIGRALLSNPRVLLLDEPLSSLDRARRGDILDALVAVRDRTGIPILMVTHDPEEAERIATAIVRL